MTDDAAIDTTNKYLVAVQGDHVRVMNPAAVLRMTKEDALLLAAWLVAITDKRERFAAVLAAVENT